jgi:hypothetical protein
MTSLLMDTCFHRYNKPNESVLVSTGVNCTLWIRALDLTLYANGMYTI